MDERKVGVVIPCYRDVNLLARLIPSIELQSYKNIEIIISNSGSDLESIDITNKNQNVTVVESPPMGPGAARNLGAKNSSAGWLLFLDADIRIDDSDFIKKLVDTSTTKGWHTATAKHKVWHGNFMAKVSASVWYSYFILLAHTKRPAAFGECILTSRNTFNRLGGFSEKVKFGEDFDYTARAVPWKFGIVSSTYYYIDPRRGNEEGIWLYIKGGVNEIYRQFHGGRVPKDIFKHKYGNHK